MDFPLAILELPGAIAEASWNGVPFFMPDSRHRVGRRVQQFFFPGQDAAQFLDLGAFDGPMRIQGILTGDLSVQYARQLEAALRTGGPGTLVHPWLGELQMVLVEPAEIVFSWRELRVVRFTATFAPYLPPGAQPESFLDALLDDVAAGITAARSFIGQVLAPVQTGLWLAGVVQSWAGAVQGYWQSVTGANAGGTFGAAGNPALAAAVAAPVAALGSTAFVESGADYGATIAGLIAAVPAAIAAASASVLAPAVGPGDAAPGAAPIDGRITMDVLLGAAGQAQAQFGAPGLLAPLSLAQAALVVLNAIQVVANIAWTSAQEAQAALARLLAALDAVAAQAAVTSVPTVGTTAVAVQAARLWTVLQAARADLIADMTVTIGRLPAVRTVTLARPMPVWRMANIIAGDDASLIEVAYADIIARNAVANPAAVGPGTIEVLAPAGLSTLVPGIPA